MEQPLNYLQQRAGDRWLIGYDSEKFRDLTERLYQTLIRRIQDGILPKVLLVEADPVRFLAGFMAACAANCPIFLGNPGWVKREWQQVLDLAQPNLIWGTSPGLLPSQVLPQCQQKPRDTTNQGWIMIPTGGSSGKIRFAIHTWKTLMASVQGFQQYFRLKQVNSFCVLPLYHVSGLMQFIRSFTSGGQLMISPFNALELGNSNADPAEFFLSLVPTQLQRLLECQDQAFLPATWLSCFQTVLLGGAPAWPELLEKARFHQISLALTYGMTETASQIATLKPEAFLEGDRTCGQILPHVDVTICSPTGEVLGASQTGIITITTAALALGYYPQPFTKTEKFQLDDLGFLDSQGCLTVVGRQSHKIITGGENVFPAEVEAAIRATRLVADICVIGIPDQHWGQAVTAIYVPGNQKLSISTLQAAIADHLSKFKWPKYWIPVTSLPRNSQGKVNYEQLQQTVVAWQRSHSIGEGA